MQTNKSSVGAFATLVSVFFFWGFVAASNDILIPVFREQLHLEQWQTQMINFAFYVAYTVGSILYFVLSLVMKRDILSRLGYKNGIALGLVISALGTLLFIPAANSESFGIMISGLFIVGLGFSLQQTAANPLAINLGDPSKGSQRLSLAGGINNIGTTIGPVLISLAIFGSAKGDSSSIGIESIKIPYLILGGAFLVAALLFKLSSIPNHLTTAVQAEEETKSGSAIQYPQLWMGMIAIFMYVGVEVATAGNLGEYLKQTMGMKSENVAPYVSLFWASLMIGRWTSAAGAFQTSPATQRVLGIALPYLAFGLFLLINVLVKNDVTPFYYYPFVILVLIVADLLSKGNPARQLLLFSFLGIISLFIGMFTTGIVAVYAFISVGLFCSTLWPCIFTLAIAGLGKHTNQGSGFLVMMIMGGGILSLVQGALASNDLLGIRFSYAVGVVCFIYLAFYAIRAAAVLRKQGVEGY
ncbi:MAG: MFS transporter [Fluviicola sp.]|jgi:FHS family L-fucose permease-like MFS transporter